MTCHPVTVDLSAGLALKGGSHPDLASRGYCGVHITGSVDLSPCLAAGLALKGGSHPDLAPHMVLERPKVMYHGGTGKFALWLHIDNANYTKATAGVAVADSPLGPFTYLGSLQPSGQMARDITVFKVGSNVRWCVRHCRAWLKGRAPSLWCLPHEVLRPENGCCQKSAHRGGGLYKLPS